MPATGVRPQLTEACVSVPATGGTRLSAYGVSTVCNTGRYQSSSSKTMILGIALYSTAVLPNRYLPVTLTLCISSLKNLCT